MGNRDEHFTSRSARLDCIEATPACRRNLNSGTSIPASRIYKDAGIVEISQAATNPAYTLQHFDTTFRVVARRSQMGFDL